MLKIEDLLIDLKKQSKSIRIFSIRIKSNECFPNIRDFLFNVYNCNNLQLCVNLYYNDINDFNIPKCPICNKNRKYYKGLTFNSTCGDKKCINEYKKSILLEHHGVDNPSKSNIIQNKKKETSLKKYGTEHYSKTDEFKNKILDKNNGKWLFQTEEFKEKNKHTLKKKYGVDNYSKTKEFSENIRNIRKNIREQKYKDIIEQNDLSISLNGDDCFCSVCNKTFNVKQNFIRDRFKYFPNIICPYCFPKGEKNTSVEELRLYEFIKSLNSEVKHHYYINNKEIDIYIPSMKIGFEYNGLYWHSELNKDKYYHRDKSISAIEEGIRLIHIWEDDWNYKQEIVKSRIKNLLNKTENKIYARNTILKEINFNDCKQFLDENHIQGCGVGNIRYGLFYKDELVSIIQVDKSGLLSRFANKLNTNVIGGFSKLFKHCEEYIKYTFIDLDWSTENNIYSKYMKFDSYIEPTWYLLYKGKRVHRRNFQKKKLLQMGLGNPEQTEHEITLNNKLYRIYNSGNIKYVRN